MSDTQAAESTEAEEQSMEEILQSIRRIITEDEETADASGEEVGAAVEADEPAADPAVEAEASEAATEAKPNGADENSADDLDALMAMDIPVEEEATPSVEAEEPATETTEEESDDPLLDIDALMETANPSAEEEKTESVMEMTQEAEEEEGDSDILELTEIVEEDSTVEETPERIEEAPELEVKEPMDVVSTPEVIEEISPVVPEEKPAPAPAERSAPEMGAQAVKAEESTIAAMTMNVPADSMLSQETAAATAALFQEVKQEIKASPITTEMPNFRSGTTVEDLMIEAMRPMLKEWLDANLPTLVERVVQSEIQKLSK